MTWLVIRCECCIVSGRVYTDDMTMVSLCFVSLSILKAHTDTNPHTKAHLSCYDGLLKAIGLAWDGIHAHTNTHTKYKQVAQM